MSRSRGKRETAPTLEAPAVCRAGFFQFAARQAFANGCVQSRGLFWCKSGRGEFEVDGVAHALEPHDLYVLPWGRRIAYRPSAEAPMFTTHVHLVPWYRPGARWVANVPHERGEAESDSPDRGDVAWPGLAGVVRLRMEADRPLARLIDYAVRWYLYSPRDESEARALGLLLVRELQRKAARAVAPAAPRPEELERLLVHVERGFHLGPRIEEMAALVGRSRSHVLRLFRRHLGVSAKRHVIDRQLREARELLLSTTLPIAEVGKAVGLPDPYYFSKLFRRHVGLAPREFRAEHGPFSTPPKPSRHRRSPPRVEA
ncbi:MAG: helix-turn-helix transcriptional regulator [Verrucomicrobia bacterium]|nr:helix-turn-helix transcriptional regulator [Verrucomicrobiota bacterium]